MSFQGPKNAKKDERFYILIGVGLICEAAQCPPPSPIKNIINLRLTLP